MPLSEKESRLVKLHLAGSRPTTERSKRAVYVALNKKFPPPSIEETRRAVESSLRAKGIRRIERKGK